MVDADAAFAEAVVIRRSFE
jgi:hypothetical protein